MAAAPLRLGLLTVSDACADGTREDRSGALLAEWATADGHEVVERGVIPDDRLTITRTLLRWIDAGSLDAVITTGGTGFGPRDVTPEATRPVLDREATGLAEALRRAGVEKTRWAVLSRGLVGARGTVAVVNLPGSPGGVRDGVAILGDMLPHVCALLRGERPEHTPGGSPAHE